MNNIENTLRTYLRNNIMVFTYRKVNGEIRHAVGTRNLGLATNYTGERIPIPTGDMQPNSYYDVEKMGWRSWKDGSVISIDGINPTGRTDGFLNTKPNKEETPVREIPVQKPVSESKPTTGGADIDKILGGLFGGIGLPMGEIRKTMDKLDKDIVIGAPAHSPKIGTPVATEKGIALPLGEIGVEDFAKMVAHYVVEELVSRLTR